MRVYVVRHAEAEDHHAGKGDAARRLTERGRLQAAGLAEAFEAGEAPLDKRPRAVVSSPAVRARQTAEPIAKALGLVVECIDTISPGAGDEDVLEAIARYAHREVRSVIIVGHNPTLAAITSSWGAGDGLKKAQVVAADVDAKSGAVRLVGKFRPDA